VRSGFRISPGGAQQLLGLEPDLSTFGKALGNGHAISVLAGRQSVMRHILRLGLTVTFYRSPDAFAAALATLSIMEREATPTILQRLGRRLLGGLDGAFQRTGVPGKAVGLEATPFVRFDYPDAQARDRAMRLYCTGMLERGVLLTPAHHWFLCTSMTDEDIDHVVAASEDTLRDMARIF